ELQMGGSDQWGNITAGIELISRRSGGTAHGLVMPLLTAADGGKFGKSEGENIWLDPTRTSPYRFYQFWLNSEDAEVAKLLKMFTIAPLEEITALAAEHQRDPRKRVAQRFLARDVTARVHGEATTGRVIAASEVLFGGRDLKQVDAE